MPSKRSASCMDGDEPRRKRIRINYTVRQLEALEGVFSQSQYPDACVIERLAAGMSVPPEKIFTWFQNRRSKFRRESKKGHIQWMRDQLYEGQPKLTSPPLGDASDTANASHVLSREGAADCGASPPLRSAHMAPVINTTASHMTQWQSSASQVPAYNSAPYPYPTHYSGTANIAHTPVPTSSDYHYNSLYNFASSMARMDPVPPTCLEQSLQRTDKSYNDRTDETTPQHLMFSQANYYEDSDVSPLLMAFGGGHGNDGCYSYPGVTNALPAAPPCGYEDISPPPYSHEPGITCL